MATRSEIEDIPQTVKGLCRMARLLGYRDPFSQLMNDDGSVVGDLLEFFEDNPGACAAVVDFVLDHGMDREGEPLEDDEEEDDG